MTSWLGTGKLLTFFYSDPTAICFLAEELLYVAKSVPRTLSPEYFCEKYSPGFALFFLVKNI
jgi:hypothetical protein